MKGTDSRRESEREREREKERETCLLVSCLIGCNFSSFSDLLLLFDQSIVSLSLSIYMSYHYLSLSLFSDIFASFFHILYFNINNIIERKTLLCHSQTSTLARALSLSLSLYTLSIFMYVKSKCHYQPLSPSLSLSLLLLAFENF